MFCPGLRAFSLNNKQRISKSGGEKSVSTSRTLFESIDYSISSIRGWRFSWQASETTLAYSPHFQTSQHAFSETESCHSRNLINANQLCLERFSIVCRETKTKAIALFSTLGGVILWILKLKTR